MRSRKNKEIEMPSPFDPSLNSLLADKHQINGAGVKPHYREIITRPPLLQGLCKAVDMSSYNGTRRDQPCCGNCSPGRSCRSDEGAEAKPSANRFQRRPVDGVFTIGLVGRGRLDLEPEPSHDERVRGRGAVPNLEICHGPDGLQ